jgi:hypothetical protein
MSLGNFGYLIEPKSFSKNYMENDFYMMKIKLFIIIASNLHLGTICISKSY